MSKERTQEVSRVNRFIKTKKSAELLKSAETGGYMNADEVETALLNLSEAHPDFITLVELPNRTWEGRLCKAICVHAPNNSGGTTTANNNSDTRTGVLITGGMHAREWGGSDICINFLTNLIDSYVNNTTINLWRNDISSSTDKEDA